MRYVGKGGGEDRRIRTIQIGAVSKLISTPLSDGLIALMIKFAYSCTPMPTPTTPKYIMSNGHSLQSKKTRRRSRIVQGGLW